MEFSQNFVAFSEYMNFKISKIILRNTKTFRKQSLLNAFLSRYVILKILVNVIYEIIMFLLVFKVHIFWEGHKILRNLHQSFFRCTASQIIGGDFANFCGLLRIYELYFEKYSISLHSLKMLENFSLWLQKRCQITTTKKEVVNLEANCESFWDLEELPIRFFEIAIT